MPRSQFGDYLYEIALVGARGDGRMVSEGAITSGALVFVYDAGTKTLSTIYKDVARTALTSPISRAQYATDGKIRFYSPNTSHDLYIAMSDGSTALYSGVTPEMHLLHVDQSPGVGKCLIAAFGASDNTETDTGLDLPYGVRIKDVEIQVVTADATETLDVGLLSSETAGDADGLLVGVSVASTGYIRPWATTVGSNETYVSSTKYGALMGKGIVGTDTNGDFGVVGGSGHVVTGSNAKSLTYTGSSGSDTAAGYIYVYFDHLR